ncbi:MAG: hypothetical protein ACWGO1_07315, partial [Anaerolineales bacterium]
APAAHAFVKPHVDNTPLAVRDTKQQDAQTDSCYSISFPAQDWIDSIQLRAQSGSMLDFQTQNGVSIQGVPAQTKELPHLVLSRNGQLTDPQERTLELAVIGLSVPTTGITLTIRMETQHPDPDLYTASRAVIPVWEKTQRVDRSTKGEQIVISHTFGATSSVGSGEILTPSDYYRLKVILTDAQHLPGNPLFSQYIEFAFLLESQWEFELPAVSEEVEGAAPDNLVVYYCDMFTYQKDYMDAASRIPRSEVAAFLRDELGPAMVEAYATQSTTWGFTWYSAWTSYRSGVDAERLSVALTLPGVWFHGRAPSSAHSGISINTTHKDYARYDHLVHGMLSAFHHELFHNIQRNINLKLGGDGDIDGEGDALAFITEGMATMASSVGQPEVEFVSDGSYLTQANTFLSGGKFYEPDLNTSYANLDPYRASIYWRFLYEQCGGLEMGDENPAVGMQVIRQTLEVLYGQSISNADDLSGLLPALMDRVLELSTHCPFNTYRQSLAQFSRSIYAIRIANLCVINEIQTWCGLYDPKDRYAAPPAEEIHIDDHGSEISGGIPNSYGMDFIEIKLPAQKTDRHVEIEFNNTSDAAEFEVQLLQIDELEPGLTQGGKALTKVQPIDRSDPVKNQVDFYIDQTQEAEQLVLIITRVDAEEVYDPVGEYALSLR